MVKYVLCRPGGGLNDCLKRIEVCHEYCKKYKRILLVDTNYDIYINEPFCKYFGFNKTNVVSTNDAIHKIIADPTKTVYPKNLQGQLLSYKRIYSKNIRGYQTDDGTPLNVLPDDQTCDIILYHTCGGGIPKLLMNKITINKDHCEIILQKYKLVPKPYISIHIRNTDYKLDYKTFYEANKNAINGKNVFLATDSIEARDYFKSKKNDIINFAQLDKDNKPLHSQSIKFPLVEALVDLIILGLGNHFILPPVQYGFTKLAYYLYNNKHVIHQITHGMLK